MGKTNSNDKTAKEKAADNAKAFGAGERHTDANPEVVSADVLEPTQAQEKAELEGHSEFERVTGVKLEEIDTRPVVDADPGNGKTFAERTSARQPWETFQDEAQLAEAKRAEKANEQMNDAHKDSEAEAKGDK